MGTTEEINIIDKKLEENNGCGYFDWLIALPVGFGYCISLSYLVPFLTQIPDLLCSHDGFTWSSCEATAIWGVEPPPMYKLDDSSSFTISNWITNRNLLCISSFNIGLFGSIYMSGYVFGALTILRLGDVYGRKPILILSSISNTIIYFLLCFAGNTYLIYALLFVDGAMRMTKGSLAYILMLELIPESKRSKFNSIIMSLEGGAAFFTVGSIYIFKDALITLFITTVISFIQFAFVVLAPESPKFLHSISKLKEANKSLEFIAKVNNSKFNRIDEDEAAIKSAENKNKDSLSFFEALKDRLYRKNLLIMAFIYWVSFMCYYVLGFYVGSFPGNLFINAFVLMGSDIIGSAFSSLWVNLLGFKHGFSAMYIVVISSTILYSLYSHELMVSYIWVFTMRFGLTMAWGICLFACSQIFDTKIQARSFAFCNFFRKTYFNTCTAYCNIKKI